MNKTVIGFKKGPLGAAGYERRWLSVLAARIVSRQVTVFMLTTENTQNMKERGKAAGVKGWIVKPFKGSAVLETFKEMVA
jgi:AmiR/NasT family two-component response regulator